MNQKYIELAINEARKAYKKGEIPVGCVIVNKNKILARTHNLKEKMKCGIYHAEILAIKKACKKMKNWRLNDCEMYVTMEPCSMCASAIKQSRIKKIYYILENSNNFFTKEILVKKDINNSVEIIKIDENINYKKLVEKVFKNKR